MQNQNQQQNYCVLCKKSRRQNQFLLECNHALCLNCLQDCFNSITSNYIECSACKKSTSIDFFEKCLDDFATITTQQQQQIPQDYVIQEYHGSSSSRSKKEGRTNSNTFDESVRNQQDMNKQQEKQQMRQSLTTSQKNLLQEQPQPNSLQYYHQQNPQGLSQTNSKDHSLKKQFKNEEQSSKRSSSEIPTITKEEYNQKNVQENITKNQEYYPINDSDQIPRKNSDQNNNRKNSQEIYMGQRNGSFSMNYPIIQVGNNDTNISNGFLQNSFDISSILPQQNQGGEVNYLQNYSSPAFSPISQQHANPEASKQQLVNVKEYLNDPMRRHSFSKQDNNETDFSQQSFVQQLNDHIALDTPQSFNQSNNSNNEIMKNKDQNYLQQNLCNKDMNKQNKTDLNGRIITTTSNNKSSIKQNTDSLFNRSNTSISNLLTLQNNNNSILPNNVNLNTQSSTTANHQSQTANQSFSQSFISPNSQSFISASGGVKCKIHQDEEANLFCFQCHDSCICVECFLGGGEHKDHEVKNVRKSFKQLIPLVQNLKERVIISTSDLKTDEQFIINRQGDIRNLCSETLTHLNRSIQEIIVLITQKGNVLQKEIEIFQQEQLNELQIRHDKIRKQLMNLQTFSESYDKILNFQGKCSEARLFNYFSETKVKVNKYITKLQKQNEEIRNVCRTKYTSCFPEHIFNELQIQIESLQIPLNISQPTPLPNSLSAAAILSPLNTNYKGNMIQNNNQKRLSSQFEERNQNSLKESKIIDIDDYKIVQGQLQSQKQQKSDYLISSSQQSSSQKNSTGLLKKIARDQRLSSLHAQNINSTNNSNYFDQNSLQNSLQKNNKMFENKKEALFERSSLQAENILNQFGINYKNRVDSDLYENEYQQKVKNNPFNLKATQFSFSNQIKNNIVKLKLQEMNLFPPEIHTSDSFVVQNGSTKSNKSTNRISRVSNNENIFDHTSGNSVKDCVQLIKNTLKTRTSSHSQLRDKSINPPLSESYRYKSALKENRYNVPNLDTKKLSEQLFMATTLTQKSTERERVSSKSNDKKIRELKKILNEGW